MVKLIIIDKACNLKSSTLKKFDIELLYKKCGLRKNDNFEKRHTWKIDDSNFVSCFSKDKGRESSINKYDLPPPIDNELYYGSILLIKHNEEELKNENVSDLIEEDWQKYYEKLFGGFEDLGEEDSYSEDEEIPEHMKTKQGYSKEGGFVVDDDEEGDEDYIPEQSDEESAHTSTDSAADEDEEEDGMGKDSDIDEEEEEEEEEDEDDEEEYDSDDLGSELSEESYIDSD